MVQRHSDGGEQDVGIFHVKLKREVRLGAVMWELISINVVFLFLKPCY